MNKKVPFNISQNSMRKQILNDLEIALNMVILTGKAVTGIDSDSQIKFNLSKEGYLLGSCLLSFNLKDNSGSDSFSLTFVEIKSSNLQ